MLTEQITIVYDKKNEKEVKQAIKKTVEELKKITWIEAYM